MSLPAPAATRLTFQNWVPNQKINLVKNGGLKGQIRPIFVKAEDFLKDFEFTTVVVVVRC
jgi:hypothetical protein